MELVFYESVSSVQSNYFSLMFPGFSVVWFSDVFRGHRKGTLSKNVLKTARRYYDDFGYFN